MVIGIFGLFYLDKKKHHPIIILFRTAYPILLSGYFYSETVFYNKLLFDNIDPLLVDIEAFIFGMQPSIEFCAYFSNKIFSEIMYFGYFSFYLFILGFTLYIFIRKKDHFNKTIFQFSASIYIFYFIFCLIPSAGPQFYFSSPENILPDAYVFDKVMHFIQKTAEQPTGAFPSSHVGISMVILILSKRIAPEFLKIAWPFVVLIILSTVYIKAHYAIDTLGGIFIAPSILYLSNKLYILTGWNDSERV
jgi:membrane-associated phospholipid phosphatase